MKHVFLLTIMVIGFGSGMILGEFGNQSAESSYLDFLENIAEVDKMNQYNLKSETVVPDTTLNGDPNLLNHK
ncbi:MAG: hypothetical protein AB8E15_13565 [Bdellovibrionales bacterium]